MTIQADISLKTVVAEIKMCEANCEAFGWRVSEIDEANQTFTVTLISPADNEVYILEFKFDEYPALPYLIEFVDPETKQKATQHAYPKCTDSFFHPNLVICHQCSRKSYSTLHKEWEIQNWRKGAGGLINLKAILDAIYFRISDKSKSLYVGRMA